MGMKILVVGCGGLGCELVKILALDNTKELTLIDDDTIDITNLNRQFLFSKADIGRSKSQTVKQKISKDLKVSSYIDRIDNFKSIDFYKGFDVVFNCLDNNEARSFVNERCFLSDTLLIDGGSAGWLGQSFCNAEECFDCLPKKIDKQYPICTVRQRPNNFEHCLVWAKSVVEDRNITSIQEELKEYKEIHRIVSIKSKIKSKNISKLRDISKKIKIEDHINSHTQSKPLDVETSKTSIEEMENSNYSEISKSSNTDMRDRDTINKNSSETFIKEIENSNYTESSETSKIDLADRDTINNDFYEPIPIADTNKMADIKNSSNTDSEDVSEDLVVISEPSTNNQYNTLQLKVIEENSSLRNSYCGKDTDNHSIDSKNIYKETLLNKINKFIDFLDQAKDLLFDKDEQKFKKLKSNNLIHTDFNSSCDQQFTLLYSLACCRAFRFDIKPLPILQSHTFTKNIIPSICTTNSIVASLMIKSFIKKKNYYLTQGTLGIVAAECNKKRKDCTVCGIPTFKAVVKKSTKLSNFLSNFNGELLMFKNKVFDKTSDITFTKFDNEIMICMRDELPNRIYFEIGETESIKRIR